MTSPPCSYRLPDLLSLCPWEAPFNPHHEEAAAASSRWVLSYAPRVIEASDRLAFFEERGSELLCAWVFPYTGPEELRTCCDFINLTYIIDEVSDRQGGKAAKSMAAIVSNAMQDDAYDDGSVLCKMTKECGSFFVSPNRRALVHDHSSFKQRFFSRAGPITSRRFLEHTGIFLNAVVKEAELREKSLILDLASYDAVRRENSGVPYCFEVIGYALGLDLPDEVYHHTSYREMCTAAVDMVAWANVCATSVLHNQCS